MASSPLAAPPPHNTEAEEACIGVAMLSIKACDTLLDDGLRAHHFYRERYGQVWSAIISLREKDVTPDVLTVASEYERLLGPTPKIKAVIDNCSGLVPAAGSARQYGSLVMELAEWRDRASAAHEMLAATGARDKEKFALAINALEHVGRERRMDSLTPEKWADVIFEYINSPPETGFIPLPFNTMNEKMGGGLLPGEILLLAGYTFHGKSIIADQMLDKAAQHDKRCHLYMTEMTAAQRGLRYLSRQTGIPFRSLRSRALSEFQVGKIMDELGKLPYGCTVAAGWDMEDVVRDALRAQYDLVVIDLIHGFHYEDERDLDRISKAAMRLARVSTTRPGHPGTAVVLVAHLSGAQLREQKSAKRPKPAMHSLKGATSLSQDPDYVMFIWQQDDDHGLPTGEGSVYMPKARGGGQVEIPVHLHPTRFRFEPVEPEVVMLGEQ